MTLLRSVFACLLSAALGAGVTYTPRPEPSDFPTQTASLNKYQHAQKQTVLVQSEDGQGSAVVFRRVNAAGGVRWFAITAAHVVENSSLVKIKVVLRHEGYPAGEITYRARVLNASPEYDLALLQIWAPDGAFEPATFGGSAVLDVGTEIFTVGNFLGEDYENSVSAGIISQVGRQHRGTVADQTTAPVYPGSSGGPAYNASGQVIGIVVARVDSTLAFFVPMRAVIEWAHINKLGWVLAGDRCPIDK